MDGMETTGGRRTGVNIDMSPLIDMVFILLIFFVVTATFTRDTGVEVEKPKAKSASELRTETILIAITREGTIHINDRQVEPGSLRDLLAQMLARNPEREIVLVADRNSITGQLVGVMDACNLAGAKKINVAAMTD